MVIKEYIKMRPNNYNGKSLFAEREGFLIKFIKLNPNIKYNNLINRIDGRIEWICSHGEGHTIWYPKGSNSLHGCDGCCRFLNGVKK